MHMGNNQKGKPMIYCNKKKAILTLLVSLTALYILSGCGEKKEEKEQTTAPPQAEETQQALQPSPTVALVNGIEITKLQLQNEMERLNSQLDKNSPQLEEQQQSIEKNMLEILIGEELLYQASKEKGITVSTEEIEQGVVQAASSFANQPAQQRFFSADKIKKSLAIEKFIVAEFSSQVDITEEHVEKFYQDNINDFTRPEQILASNILIKIDDGADLQAQEIAMKKISEIQQKIKNNEDFIELAKMYSEDSGSSAGGALSYFKRGEMLPSIEETIFNLEAGQVSDIFRTKFGLHLVKVMEKSPAQVIAYEKIEEKLKNFLKQRGIREKIDRFIESSRQKADINILL